MHRHPSSAALRGTTLAAHLFCAGIAACAAFAAQAQPAAEAARSYAIPAGPLGPALNRLGRESGALITFAPELVAGVQTRGASGSLGTRQALEALLAGTGLQAMAGPGGAYTLRRVPEAGRPAGAAAAGGVATLAEVRVTAEAEPSATTEGRASYAAPAISIGKGDHALKDIPQSVSVLTRQQMDDQGVTDLREAANSVTGVVGAKGVGPGMALTARGFQIDYWQYDGVPIARNVYSLGNWSMEDMVFWDRMEVLRGASGLLQGTGSPGGAVNLVRKRGTAEKQFSLTAKAGSWDRYGVQLDAGGPLNDSGTVRGRAIVSEDRGHSFVDYVNQRTRTLYGALDWDVTPDTTAGLGVADTHIDGRPMMRGLPRYADGSDIGLPRSTFTGAWWNRAANNQTMLFADLAHRFGDGWKFKLAAVHLRERNSSANQRMHATGAGALPDGSGMTYADWVTNFHSRRWGLDAYVDGRFDALGLRHEVVLGGNLSRFTSDDLFARRFTNGGNIFDVDHDRPAIDWDSLAAGSGTRSWHSGYDIEQKGVYGTWRMQLTPALTTIAGARLSWYDYLYADASYSSTMKESAQLSPYLGAIYALTPEWSAYASYSDVFEPQSARTAAGDVLKPIVGRNAEVGVKGTLMEGKVNTSLALFRYDHRNRAVTDYGSGYACDDWYCSKSSGKVRSQGMEAEVSGEVLRGLQLAAGYAYNTTRFLSDPDNQGKVFSQWTPRHLLRVWSSYRLPGAGRQWSVGGGVTAQSHTVGDDRSFTIPGFAVWNARVAWQATPEVSVALNLNNVFDKRYYIPGYNYTDGGNEYGNPRNVMLTLRYTPRW